VKNPFLIGNRIYFRPLEKSDAPVAQRWFNDPVVRRGTLQHRPLSLAAEEGRIAQLADNPAHLVCLVAMKESDEPIGMCGLHEISLKDRCAEFGCAIGEPAHWGRGLGSELTALMVGYGFDTLNLNRIHLTVFDDNAAAIRVYEKAGFRREGVLRQGQYREGRYWDLLMMSILRDEYSAIRDKSSA
jgi:RimJ/RimL family protein N-acetyltransferase